VTARDPQRLLACPDDAVTRQLFRAKSPDRENGADGHELQLRHIQRPGFRDIHIERGQG